MTGIPMAGCTAFFLDFNDVWFYYSFSYIPPSQIIMSFAGVSQFPVVVCTVDGKVKWISSIALAKEGSLLLRWTPLQHRYYRIHHSAPFYQHTKTIPHRVMWKGYLILKPVWFLAFPRPNGLMAGREKTKAWLPARHVVQAGSYPRTGKRRGLYSNNFFRIFSKNYFKMSINKCLCLHGSK
jgi:hypothetical protein